MVGENAAPMSDFKLPPRCCGEWADDFACRICGHQARPAALASIIDARFEGLGEN